MAKFETVSFVESPLNQIVGLKGYVFAEIPLSLVWGVPSALQSQSLKILASQKCINTHKISCLQSGAWLKIIASVPGV
ncbi:TPA: hypothetical protein ACMDT1_004564 [Vibrio parahaemolyticus]